MYFYIPIKLLFIENSIDLKISSLQLKGVPGEKRQIFPLFRLVDPPPCLRALRF